jgi:aquaporin Z
MRSIGAELFGTFCLVFAGTGAVVVNDLHGGVITHIGVALAFGLTVLAMIYAIGDLSGCHLNPAVTLSFAVARRFDRRKVIPYVLAQCAGAILASTALRLMFPAHQTLGATLPTGTPEQSWAMEFVLSLMLLVVVLSVATGSKEKGALAGVAIGAVIALEALFGGPVSGASMNPARSLGPAVIALRFDHLWIYLTSPVAGALTGVVVCRLIHPPGHCCGRKARASPLQPFPLG